MIQVDLAFPHNYEIQEPPELPGSGRSSLPLYYFPRLGARPERDGFWIHVIPANGKPWLGVFGGDGGTNFTRVFSTPDPDRFCVIAQGEAFLVLAASPDQWKQIWRNLVTYACPVAECGLIVLATFDGLAALDRSGVAWENRSLCCDDLRVIHADAERIEGTGYDPMNESTDIHFSLDTKTGNSLIEAPRSMNGKPLW
jgi:hypothetical protein